MIIDLDKFVREERQYWNELEKLLVRGAGKNKTLEDVRRFHYLYKRASSDLGKVQTFAASDELIGYLEQLVSQAYYQIHRRREKQKFLIGYWFSHTVPQAFRNNLKYFILSLSISFAGALFGGFLMIIDENAKAHVLPAMFANLNEKPSERVARDEQNMRSMSNDEYMSGKVGMTGFYLINNSRVSFLTVATGFTILGTIIALFFNGILLGVVVIDYIVDGQGVFVSAWLLPHGSVELSAIFIAGQCGIMIAHAMLGTGVRKSFLERFKAIRQDLSNLIGLIIILIFMAAFIESWFSQLHQPMLNYYFKIAVGLVLLTGLYLWLFLSGRKEKVSLGDD
ncbi:MAG: stage II sporulation protein M [Lentisphaeria bacterium]|nr:stage II sporulation protein M [Lentisphaeria bacterium]NQZ69299.1 stage II sporulation protein M [Lentisphaeria bacterium]